MRCSCPIFYTSLSATLAGKSDKLPGRQVSVRAEGSFPIVESSPRFHLLLSIIQGQEPVFIQALLAEPPIEGLDEGVVLGLQPAREVQGQRCSAEPSRLDKIETFRPEVRFGRETARSLMDTQPELILSSPPLPDSSTSNTTS